MGAGEGRERGERGERERIKAKRISGRKRGMRGNSTPLKKKQKKLIPIQNPTIQVTK